MTVENKNSFENSLAGNFLNLASTANEALVSFTGTTGIAGFVFDIKEDEEISLESDITDHYTESNNPVQDNIVTKPVKVTLRGSVGELVYTPPKDESSWDKLKNKVQKTTEKLTIIGSYLPAISTASNQVYQSLSEINKNNIANPLLDIGSAAFDLYNSINSPKDKQSHAFMFFEALWQAKQTFVIQTPYRYYANMAIESIKAVQSSATRDITDFEITFKQIRTVISNLPEGKKEKTLFGRLKEQASSFEQNYLNGFFGKAGDSISEATKKISSLWKSGD